MYEPFFNTFSDAIVTTPRVNASGDQSGSMASVDFVTALRFKIEEPKLSTIAHEEATVSVVSYIRHIQ